MLPRMIISSVGHRALYSDVKTRATMCGTGGPISFFIIIPLVVNGNGAPPALGVQPGDLRIPFAFTIVEWTILGGGVGSAQLDIWMKPYAVSSPPTVANSIVAAAPPALVAAQSASSSVLTGWTVAFPADTAIRWSLTSVAGINFFTLQLKVRRTIG